MAYAECGVMMVCVGHSINKDIQIHTYNFVSCLKNLEGFLVSFFKCK